MVQFPDLPNPQTIKQPLPGVPLQSFLAGKYTPPLPQALNAANPGQQVSALVLAVNAQGQALVQTPQGLTALTARLPLAAGQQIVLEVLPKSGRGENLQPLATGTSSNFQTPDSSFTARIVKVNGQAPEQFFPASAYPATDEDGAPLTRVEATIVRAATPEQSGKAQTNVPITSAPATEVELGPSASPNSAQPLRAVVLNPVPNSQTPAVTTANNPVPLPTVNSGDTVVFRIVPNSITLPSSPAPAATPQTAAPAAPAPVLPANIAAQTIGAEPDAPGLTTPPTQTAAATPQPAAATTPVATQTTAPATQTTAPATTPAPATPAPLTATTSASSVVTTPQQLPPAPAGSFNLPATIIAMDPAGEPVAHTTIGTLRLPAEVPLPKGTTLTLQVSSIEASKEPALGALLPQAFTTGNLATDALVRGTTGLDSLLKHLFSMNPSAANQAAQNIPQPGRQFASRVLNYLESVKDGSFVDDFSSPIPRNLANEAGMPKLAQEFIALTRAYSEAGQAQQQQANSWTYTLVPVMQGEDTSHMRWFKREQQGSAKNPNAKGTRFVIELETESLGEIQMDGLFFKNPKKADFDLVIRSHEPFNEEDQNAMQGIFTEFGEIAGYAGQLKFQSVARFPVNPLNEITEETPPHHYSA